MKIKKIVAFTLIFFMLLSLLPMGVMAEQVEGQEKTVVFTIDKKAYQAEGKEIPTDAAPYIKNGRTMVPVAFVAPALGTEPAQWLSNDRMVMIKKGDKRIYIKIDSKELLVNQQKLVMDVAAEIKDIGNGGGRTMLPISFIARALDVGYQWDGLARTVHFYGYNKTYAEAGIFGPDMDTEVIEGNVIIKADGVKLKNMTVKGNLIVAEEVGKGTVTLENINVQGETFIRGGGKDSIHIIGGSYSNITIQNVDGQVRVTSIGVNNLPLVIGEGASGEEVILEGNFGIVKVEAQSAKITTRGQTVIAQIDVVEQAQGTVINLASTTIVTKVVLEAKAEVTGTGTIKEAEIKADGVKFAKAPEKQTVASNVTIQPTTTTGTSTSSGGGGSSTPTVVLNSVSNISVASGQSTDVTVTSNPTDAAKSAVSSNANVASVTASGNTLTVNGIAAGTATITVTASKSGFNSVSKSFTVTVTSGEPDPDVELTNLVLSGSPSDFTFAESTYTYEDVTVPNNQKSITVTPTLAGSTITVNGAVVSSGEASAPIALTAGVEREIIVNVVKAGTTSKNYLINVTRIPVWSHGATIEDITLEPTGGSITYGPDSGLYTIDGNLTVAGTLAGSVTLRNLKVTGDLIVNTPNATVTIEESVEIDGNTDIQAVSDNTFNSGGRHNWGIGVSGSARLILSGFARFIPVVINTNNPIILEGQMDLVQVSAPNANITFGGMVSWVLVEQNGANLNNNGGTITNLLKVNGISDPATTGDGLPPVQTAADKLINLSTDIVPLTPAFNSSTYKYNATVANGVESITVTPSAAPGTTAVVKLGGVEKVGGIVNGLQVGTNTITVVVSQNGRADLTYTLTLIRQEEPQAAPTFSPTTGAVAFGTSLQIISVGADYIYYTTDGTDPAAAVAGSTKLYNDNARPVISGAMTFKALAVKSGRPNSSYGESAYTQVATADLTNIVLSGSPANFTFDGSIYVYNGVTVANNVTSITVTPTGGGTITVDGTAVLSGQASQSIALEPGVEEAIVVAATESGKSAKTYTINVTRALSGDARVASADNHYTVDNDANTITTGQTPLTEAVTVGTFLGNLTKHTDAAWKVVATGTSITNSGEFDSTAAKGAGDNLAAGDLLAVKAQDGTIKVYALDVEELYTLTLEANPLAGGILTDNTDAGPYAAGAVINVTAAANTGYKLVSWEAARDELSTNVTFDYTMPAQDITLYANFEPILPAALNISALPGSIVVNIESIEDSNGDSITFAQGQSIYGLDTSSSIVELFDGENTISLNLNNAAFSINTATIPETITIDTSNAAFATFDSTNFDGTEYVEVTLNGTFGESPWSISDTVTGMDNIAVAVAKATLEGAAVQGAFSNIIQGSNIITQAQGIVNNEVSGVTVTISNSSNEAVAAVNGNALSAGNSSIVFALSKGTESGSTAVIPVTVVEVPSAPVANDDTAAVDEDGAVLIAVLANDTDLNNDVLSITGFTQGTYGTVTQEGNSLEYTPDTDYHGTDSFTYEVSDGKGGTDTATVNVTINAVNDAPVASDDTSIVEENSSVLIDVLANDTDVDGDTLFISGLTQGTNGTVNQDGDDLRYTPNTDYNGADSFTYDVSDGNGGTATATVNVTVNEAPITPPEGDLLDAAAGSDFIGVLYKKSDGNIYYNQADASGTWSSEVLMGAGTEGRMAVDGTDKPHVAYTTSGKIGYRMYDGSAWTAEVLIGSNYGGNCSKPDIAVDGNGKAHITYTDTLGNQGDDFDKNDIMYANNTLGSFLKSLIFNGYGYYNFSNKVNYLYYNNGSKITVNTNGDYFIAAHHEDFENTGYVYKYYSIKIASAVGNGSTESSSSNVYATYDMVGKDGVPFILYKESSFKTAELIGAGTVSFSNINEITASTVSAVQAVGTDVVVAGKDGSYLQINFNGISQTFNEIVIEATSNVSIVNINGTFYAVYTDNADSMVKFVEVVEPAATFTLTLEANPEAGGTVTDNTDAGPYAAGTEISVTAAAGSGYDFVNWTVDEVEVGTSSTFDYTMPDSDTTLVANFASIPVAEITVSAEGGATTVAVGETLQMSAEVLPTDALDSTVTWSVVASTGSATIDGAGLLTGTGEGIITVKATANDGSGEAGSYEVTVTAVPLPEPAAFIPVENADDVDVNPPTSVEFDKDVTENDLSGITITYNAGADQVANVAAAMDGDNRTLNISHDALAHNTTYTVTIPADSVRYGTNGNGEITWSFTTRDIVSATIAPSAEEFNYYSREDIEAIVTWVDATQITGVTVSQLGDEGYDYFGTEFSVTDNGDGTATLVLSQSPFRDAMYNGIATFVVSFDVGSDVSFEMLIKEDEIPPVFAETYPKVENISATQLDLLVKINEYGEAYFAVYDAGSTAPPNSSWIDTGTVYPGGEQLPENRYGNFALTADMEGTVVISGLTASTAYDIYVFALDENYNQTFIEKIEVSTTEL